MRNRRFHLTVWGFRGMILHFCAVILTIGGQVATGTVSVGAVWCKAGCIFRIGCAIFTFSEPRIVFFDQPADPESPAVDRFSALR